MRAQRLDDLAADAHHRVERIFRILQDHGDAVAAQRPALARRDAEQVDAVEGELAGRHLGLRRRQAHDGAAGLRLARADLADDAEPLAAEREGDAAHRLDQRRCGSGK